MAVYDKLATRIRTLRNKRKWSQEELADRAGLHRTYISHLEGGKRQISVETLCKIAKGLNITSSELMKGIDI
ncbi:MAG: XRE family transcriptional regulator [Alphaproteobacteria bacterium PRO2]|nr:XRE family transcriptional regulator [Alphaproteobacteria bacterium PRO2]